MIQADVTNSLEKSKFTKQIYQHQPKITTSSSTSSTSSSSSSSSGTFHPNRESSLNIENKIDENCNSSEFNKKELTNFSNRRESLFYHSVDNQRINQRQQNLFIEYQHKLLKEQQKKFIEQQKKLGFNREINHIIQNENKKELLNNTGLKPIEQGRIVDNQATCIMHSTPFNVTNNVQPISDLFDTEKNYETEKFANFKRHDINQLSTKSQPACQSDLVLKNIRDERLNKKNFKNFRNQSYSLFNNKIISNNKFKTKEDLFHINDTNMLIVQKPAQV
jgi:hypothetical protein